MVLKNHKIFKLNKKINKYNSNRFNIIILSEKFINCLMKKGKKSISEKIFFTLFKLLQKTILKNMIIFFKLSILNSSITFSVHKIKNKKNIIREIPFMLSSVKRVLWAVKNIIKIITINSTNSCFVITFKNEIIKILKKNSEILLKKKEINLYALKHKAYAHFRWF